MDEYIAAMTVPELVELIRRLIDELELMFMEVAGNHGKESTKA